MKTNYSLTFALIFATMIFTSCQEDTYKLDFEQDINVTIQGIVYDNEGNVPLDSVKVGLGSDTVLTGKDGTYKFVNQSSGSYLLRFSKDGYATMVQNIAEGGREFTANSIVNTSPIFMFESNQTLSTKIFVGNGPENIPVANKEVILEISSLGSDEKDFDQLTRVASEDGDTEIFFENNIIKTTTDELGAINISNLPNQEIELRMNFIENGYKYTLYTSDRPADFSLSYFLGKQSVSEFRLTQTNVIDAKGNAVNDFNPTSNISFTFSDPIDASYEDMNITLEKDGNLDIISDVTISSRSITINPKGTELEKGDSYTVRLDIQSTNDIGYTRDFVFTVADDAFTLGKVTGLNLDKEEYDTDEIFENTTNVRLEFTEVDGAEQYEIYGRHSAGTDEFILLTTPFISGDGDNVSVNLLVSGIEVPEGSDGLFDGGATFTIIVRAKTGSTFGEFSDELVIKEGDTRGTGAPTPL